MTDALNITMECVRYCPEGYTKEDVDGIDTCVEEEPRGIYNNKFLSDKKFKKYFIDKLNS